MFPTNDDDEQKTNPDGTQPAQPQSSYPPVESQYPPAEGTYTPPQQSNPYSSQPQPQSPNSSDPNAQQPGQWQNPYSQHPQTPNPYGSQPQNNPYSTPLAGAPNSQPNPDPYSQPNPNPYGQQPTSPYSQPNPYGQQTNNPYPAPQTNQPWQPGGYTGMQYGGSYSLPVDGNRILAYGILSFFCLGIILGPIAIVQANQAIAAIDSGQADPNQRGKCVAEICGIIGTILWALRIGFAIISFAMSTAHGS